MEKKEENYPLYNVFREQYGRLAEEIGISFEESLTRLIRLWALLHGLTASLISDNVQWNNEWQSCLKKNLTKGDFEIKKIILTGDRPTGRLHVGHYVGSLKERVR